MWYSRWVGWAGVTLGNTLGKTTRNVTEWWLYSDLGIGLPCCCFTQGHWSDMMTDRIMRLTGSLVAIYADWTYGQFVQCQWYFTLLELSYIIVLYTDYLAHGQIPMFKGKFWLFMCGHQPHKAFPNLCTHYITIKFQQFTLSMVMWKPPPSTCSSSPLTPPTLPPTQS